MKYRAEIDGLRALAVVSVILFHAGFELFSGGFVGVDVLFVISGYLITTILIKDIENKRFSLIYFYERRARRILPALFVMLLITYLVSFFIFLPGAHKVVGQYTVASILSLANILLYLKGNDYFGLETGSNPLFHTWSLGVEEQFYIFFPIIFLIIFSFAKKRLIWLIFSLALLSFCFSEFVSRSNPTANFYLPHTRAWELLAGSIAAFIVRKEGVNSNNSYALLGIAAIIFSIVFYGEATPFPSAYSLIPVLGTVLIILYSGESTVTAGVLRNKYFVSIGLVSYSAYLWHLPLQIFIAYFFASSALTIFCYFVSLMLFSYLSYRFIEKPFRKGLGRTTTFLFLFGSAASLSALGVYGHINGGYPERQEILAKLQHNNGWGLRCNGNVSITEMCSNSSNPQIAILGNSYAMTWVNAIKRASSEGVVQLTRDTCVLGYIDKMEGVDSMPCNEFYEQAVQTINNSDSIQTVVISSAFDGEIDNPDYQESFEYLLEKISGKKLIVIGPTPRAPFNVGECLYKSSWLGTENACDFLLQNEHSSKVEALSKIVLKTENAQFIDIMSTICPDGYCKMRPEENVVMYIDTGHLSLSGAAYVYSKIGIKL